MGRHSPAVAQLDCDEANRLQEHAADLVIEYNAAQNGTVPMDRAEWIEWEGHAYAILRELARG